MPRPVRSRRRGSILLLSIFFLMVLFFLGMAFLELLPVESRAAGRQKLDASSFYAADSGVLHALSFLENRVKKGAEPLPGGVGTHTLRGSTGEWDWRATLQADEQTPPNGENTIRVYTIRSEARLDGVTYRAVEVDARQETFARFAWFEESRDPSLWIPANLWHFDGPFHSNARIRVSVPPGYYTASGRATFEGEVTTTGVHQASPDGVDYGGETPYDRQGNPLPERYRRLYANGREALRTGVKQVEVPTDAAVLSTAALGGAGTMPTAPGVHLGLEPDSNGVAGGVIIVGKVDAMTLAVESGGNRSVTIKQGGTVTKVVEVTDTAITDPTGAPVPVGSTLVLRSGGFSVHSGLTNGTVYSTGDISNLQGVNKGKRTIAVDLAGHKEIVLGGDLTRADTPVGQKPQGSRDSLGIVAYKVRVPTTVGRGNPLDVYAAIFAGVKGSDGGLYVDDPYGSRPGKVRLFGGLMQSHKPVWGTFGGSTLYSGISMDSSYDPQLASSPPPFFPTIGKFRVMRYRDEPVAGH